MIVTSVSARTRVQNENGIEPRLIAEVGVLVQPDIERVIEAEQAQGLEVEVCIESDE